jgi:hypothetical protein
MDPAIEREITSGNTQRPLRKAPYPVVLIALFQFFKSGFLLYLFLQFCHGYSARAVAGRPYDSAFLDSIFMILFPALSVVYVVIGWGLLKLRPWARGFLIGAIICTWVGGRYGSHLSLDVLFFSNGMNLGQQRLSTIFCVFLLDLFVFCTLVFYPDIAKTFDQREDKDLL